MSYLPTMTTGGLPEDSPANELSQSLNDITPDPAKMDEIAPKVIEALKTVYDPEIPVDIYELGLIYKVDIDDDRNVTVDMTLTAPGCPVAGDMPGWVQNAVGAVEGVNDVKVNLVFEPPWDHSRMSDEARVALNMW